MSSLLFAVILICMDAVNFRNFMYRAYARGFTYPEYAFTFCTYLINPGELYPWIHDPDAVVPHAIMEQRKAAFIAVNIVSM